MLGEIGIVADSEFARILEPTYPACVDADSVALDCAAAQVALERFAMAATSHMIPEEMQEDQPDDYQETLQPLLRALLEEHGILWMGCEAEIHNEVLEVIVTLPSSCKDWPRIGPALQRIALRFIGARVKTAVVFAEQS